MATQMFTPLPSVENSFPWVRTDVPVGATSAAPGFFDTPAGAAATFSFVELGQAVMNDYIRKQQNRALEEWKAKATGEAIAASTNQAETLRRSQEREKINARVQAATINREALKRRGAAMVRAGVSGVGGSTTDAVIAEEEMRQTRMIASLEASMKAQQMEQGTQALQGVFTQERSRLLQINNMQPQQSTLAPDLMGAALSGYQTYLAFQGAQKQGTQGAIAATR